MTAAAIIEAVAAVSPPTTPATGGDASNLALAGITLAFVIFFAVLTLPALRRRERDSRVRRGWRP